MKRWEVQVYVKPVPECPLIPYPTQIFALELISLLQVLKTV
jgi:hypothetical protein